MPVPGPAGAWGQKPSDAIRAPPKPGMSTTTTATNAGRGPPGQHSSHTGGKSNNHYNANPHQHNKQQKHVGGRGGGGRTSATGGRGRGRSNHNNLHSNHNQTPNSPSSSNQNHNSQHYHRSVLNVDMLTPGEGNTATQKKVKRFTADTLLEVRLNYLDKPSTESPNEQAFNPPPLCAWLDDNRIEEIHKIADLPSKLGDVSKVRPRQQSTLVKDTAPPLEECTPLKVNDATRWKAKVFASADSSTTKNTNTTANEEGDSNTNTTTTATTQIAENDQEVLKKALLLLNKLSLTKFDKLAQEFLDTGIGQTQLTLSEAVNMIVEKAQLEPHFSSMYSRLCLFLTKASLEAPPPTLTTATATSNSTTTPATAIPNKKAFKKLLLSRCQAEFEEDISSKIAKAVQGASDPEERAYLEGIIKKKYLGHMRFIGELYKGDLIKLDIMLFCLAKLLEGYEEEKIECFAKLMTTVGYPLEQQSASMALAGKHVAKEKLDECWSKVDQIISEGASARIKFMLLDLKEMKDNGWITRRKEEKIMTIDQIHKEVAIEEANAARRSSASRSSIGNSLRRSSSDLRKPIVDQDGFIMPTSRSSGNLVRATSDLASGLITIPSHPKPVRRAQSFHVAPKTTILRAQSAPMAQQPTVSIQMPLPAPDIRKKSVSMLKEFYVNGDLTEALLSIDEIVGVGGDNGPEERAIKLIDSCVSFSLEGRPADVDKMLMVLRAAHEQGKVPDRCFLRGLDDPLEFLSDIELDAPDARKLLDKIVAEFAAFATGESFEAAAAIIHKKA